MFATGRIASKKSLELRDPDPKNEKTPFHRTLVDPSFILFGPFGNSINLLKRRETLHDFVDSVLVQRAHSRRYGVRPNLLSRGIGEDQFTNFAVDDEHLVNTDAAAKTGFLTAVAALTPHES